MDVKPKKRKKRSAPSTKYQAKTAEVQESKQENADQTRRSNLEIRAQKAQDRGDRELARRLRAQMKPEQRQH